MKVISLSRPWPWTIFELPEPYAKRIENRSWRPPPDVIGEFIAIHAAKSWDEKGATFIGNMLADGSDPLFRDDPLAHPCGVIVGVVRVVSVLDINTDTPPDGQRGWFFGPFGWVLDNVIAFAKPIEQTGAQGLRFLTSAVEAAVREQMAAAA